MWRRKISLVREVKIPTRSERTREEWGTGRRKNREKSLKRLGEVFYMCIFISREIVGKRATVYFLKVEYSTAVRGLPHSRQRAFNRDVINPQDGHILCDPKRAACGFSLSIHRSSRIVNSTISRKKETLVALMTGTLPGEFRVSD
jgi:hypothetical protein